MRNFGGNEVIKQDIGQLNRQKNYILITRGENFLWRKFKIAAADI
jgi:hypothetical protein